MNFFSELFKSSAIYTLSNFLIAAIPFFLLPILTRALTPEEYGLIGMFMVTVAIFGVFTGLSSHGAIMVRYFDRADFNINSYISSAFLILFFSTILVLLFSYLLNDLITEITKLPLKWIIAAGFVALFQYIIQIMLVILQSTKKAFSYSIVRFFQASLDASLSLILVLFFLLSWEGRLFGISIAWMVVAIFSILFLIRNKWINFKIESSHTLDILYFGVPLIPHAIGGIIIGMIDRVLVANILDVNSVGIYMVAVQVGLILGIAADSFNKAFAPWFMDTLSNISHEKKIKLVRLSYLYFALILFIAFLGSKSAGLIIYLLVGDLFYDAIPLLKYILFGNAFLGMYYIITNYIFYTRKTGYLSILTISVGIITICLSYYLLNTQGIVGAAKAFMYGQLLMFLVTWLMSAYFYKMPWLSAIIKIK